MSKMADNYYNQSDKWLKGIRQSLQRTNSNIDNSYDAYAKGINSKYESNINQFQNDKATQQANALASGRQAYRQYMNSINPFSATQGQLARSGLANSGYAESYGIRANNNYQSNVGNINTQRDLALANLDSQIANARNQLNNELSENEMNRNKALYENFMNWLGQQETAKKEQEAQAKAKASGGSGRGSRGGSGGSYLTTGFTDTEPATTKKASPKKTTKKGGNGGKLSKSSFTGKGSFGKKLKKSNKQNTVMRSGLGLPGLRIYANLLRKTKRGGSSGGF